MQKILDNSAVLLLAVIAVPADASVRSDLVRIRGPANTIKESVCVCSYVRKPPACVTNIAFFFFLELFILEFFNIVLHTLTLINFTAHTGKTPPPTIQ